MEGWNQFAAVRKLGKVGTYSYCVTLPKAIIQELKWRTKQRVVVSLQDQSIVITDWKTSK